MIFQRKTINRTLSHPRMHQTTWHAHHHARSYTLVHDDELPTSHRSILIAFYLLSIFNRHTYRAHGLTFSGRVGKSGPRFMSIGVQEQRLQTSKSKELCFFSRNGFRATAAFCFGLGSCVGLFYLLMFIRDQTTPCYEDGGESPHDGTRCIWDQTANGDSVFCLEYDIFFLRPSQLNVSSASD